MIKTFDEYISERLFNSNVKRAQNDIERIEDSVDTNMRELEEIDLGLPFYIADKDLVWKGSRWTNYHDWKQEVLGYIKKSKWRLMTKEDIELINQTPEILKIVNHEANDESDCSYIWINKHTKEEVVFYPADLVSGYEGLIKVENPRTKRIDFFSMKINNDLELELTTGTGFRDAWDPYCIRLVKDKK